MLFIPPNSTFLFSGYLLITNLIYKREALKALEIAKGNTKRLMARIDKALKT